MTTFNELPVFKGSYDLLVRLFQIVQHFPREYKYSLGEQIKHELIALISNIYKATVKKGGLKNISLAQEKLALVQLYWKLCFDLHLVTSKIYISFVPIFTDLGRQLSRWEQSIS